MENRQKHSKKNLNFFRPTFEGPEFKLPCIDLRNQAASEQSHKKRIYSEKSGFADDEDESSRDSDSSSINSVAVDKVAVYLRLKPTGEEIPKSYTFDEDTNNVILIGNQLNQLTNIERQYTFTSILGQSADQKTVYDSCVRSVLADPFSSTGAVFSSYGVSNSGKTFTILGEKAAGGVVPRALVQIFSEYEGHIAQFPRIKCSVANDQITSLDPDQVVLEMEILHEVLGENKQIRAKLTNNWIADIKKDHQFIPKQTTDYQQVYIWISFVEIYNEKIIDLFKGSKGATSSAALPSLRIIANNRNPFILGLTWICVANIENALELLQVGLRRVNYASTGINAHSSRSHNVFTINMISECDSNYEFSSYKFCDLAGAERISKTGNVGERLKEAGGINTSLHVLGRCLEAVQHNQKPAAKKEIIPVRESKLTFLLQSSLTGREKFVMIVNLLPNLECFEENINVLHFGSIANKITTRKAEVRKFSRRSRYSYFMQHAVSSPKMNSSLVFNESYSFTDRDESSMDLSFKRSQMSSDQLREELRKKDIAYAFLWETIEKKEREFLQKERDIRLEHCASLNSARERERNFHSEQQMLQKSYHEKKVRADI